MASAGKVFRLSTSGADQTSREFGKVGEAGRKMGADIAKGAKGVSPAMRGLDTAVGQAKGSIDGLAGKAGALGGVLSSMGPIGLAAAAGVGALGAAFFEAARRGEQAIEWAESLDLLSQRLDTSTRSVQEWRFAASQFGVDAGKTDAALEKLNNTIGLASRGIPKATKLFQALGFTDDQIKGFRDVDSVLPQVAEKLAALEPAARAGLANKLGLSELLPLLKDGRVGVEDLKKQFEELGLVIDDGALRRAAEDNDRLDVATARAEATTQRINLALTPVASLWGEAKAAAAEYFEEIFDGFRGIEERSDRVLKKQLESLESRIEEAGRIPFVGASIQKFLGEQAFQTRTELRERDVRRRNEARGRSSRGTVLDGEDPTEDPKGTAKTDPARAAAESYIKTQMEAMRVREGMNAVEAQGVGLSQEDVKSKWELIEAYRRIDEARKLGVALTDAEAQALKDSIKADQDKAAALRERDAAERVAAERQSRAASAAQYFETPLMRYKREAAELRDLQQGGELSDEDARRGLKELNKEYEELARRQFEASDAGQLLGGVLKGQIRNVKDFKLALLDLVQQKLFEKLFGQLGILGDALGGGGGLKVPGFGGGMIDLGGKKSGGGLSSLLGKGLSFLFGGGRATGGPVMPGLFYRVNENTPRSEWFAPSVPGSIVTAAQMDNLMQRSSHSGVGATLNFAPVIHAPGADSSALVGIRAELDRQRGEFARLLQGFDSRVWNAVNDGQARRFI